jgi:hypothetical protein
MTAGKLYEKLGHLLKEDLIDKDQPVCLSYIDPGKVCEAMVYAKMYTPTGISDVESNDWKGA